MKVRYSARTDVGLTRSHNEDCWGWGPVDPAASKGYLLVVCDGMGGHAAGEVASRLAVDTILSRYYDSSDPDRAHVLEESFLQANEYIYNQGHGSMGTTGVAALFYEDALHVANVGDSRAYMIRDGSIRQLTQDHSFVAEQVAAGLLTPDQARHSIHKNVITRALGYQSDVAVDMTRWQLHPGDLVLLSSDGLHNLVEDEELASLSNQADLDDLAKRLVDLANERGGSDNITVALARIERLDADPAPVEAAPPPVAPPAAQSETTNVPAAASKPTPAKRQELSLTFMGALLAGLAALALLSLALVLVSMPSVAEPAIAPQPPAPPSAIATTVATVSPVLTRATSAPTASPAPTQATTAAPTASPTVTTTPAATSTATASSVVP